MPTRNVNLTDELDRFVLAKVESGRYENASEVVRAALRTLEREEQQYQLTLTALRAAKTQATPAALPRATSLRGSARNSTWRRPRVSPWPRVVSHALLKPTW